MPNLLKDRGLSMGVLNNIEDRNPVRFDINL